MEDTVLTPGTFVFSPYRIEFLSSGVYCANGDLYAVPSPQWEVLLSLSDEYKEDWSIVMNDGYVNLPNWYTADGRGFFPRASDAPGVEQGDATRPITGSASYVSSSYGFIQESGIVTGAFKKGTARGYSMTGQPVGSYDLAFDSGQVVPTAEENRPINKGLVVGVYLGV